MQYRRLGTTDMNVSVISFGASVFNNFFNDSKFENTPETYANIKKIINEAFKLGINYFDVAPWYGNAQHLLSIGLKEHERSTYYLATKIGRYNSKNLNEWFDFSYNKTIESVEESLRIFDCDYIDLIQVHDFEFAPDLSQIVNETLPALAELKQQGKVRYIGINSYIIEKLKELLEISPVKIDTVLTFTHLTLNDTSLLEHVDYFRKKGLGIINSAPLSMGLYTDIGPPSWNLAPEKVKEAVKLAREYCKAKNVDLIKLAVHFSATNTKVDTTIISMSSVKIVQDNVSFLSELDENEKKVLEEIRNKFFIPLDYQGYFDSEVKLYNENKSKISK